MTVAENGDIKITWDTTVYMDKSLNYNQPDFTLVRKNIQEWTIFDTAVPADKKIINTKKEKADRYQDLA